MRRSALLLAGLAFGMALASCSPPPKPCRPGVLYLRRVPRMAPRQERVKWVGLPESGGSQDLAVRRELHVLWGGHLTIHDPAQSISRDEHGSQVRRRGNVLKYRRAGRLIPACSLAVPMGRELALLFVSGRPAMLQDAASQRRITTTRPTAQTAAAAKTASRRETGHSTSLTIRLSHSMWLLSTRSSKPSTASSGFQWRRERRLPALPTIRRFATTPQIPKEGALNGDHSITRELHG